MPSLPEEVRTWDVGSLVEAVLNIPLGFLSFILLLVGLDLRHRVKLRDELVLSAQRSIGVALPLLTSLRFRLEKNIESLSRDLNQRIPNLVLKELVPEQASRLGWSEEKEGGWILPRHRPYIPSRLHNEDLFQDYQNTTEIALEIRQVFKNLEESTGGLYPLIAADRPIARRLRNLDLVDSFTTYEKAFPKQREHLERSLRSRLLDPSALKKTLTMRIQVAKRGLPSQTYEVPTRDKAPSDEADKPLAELRGVVNDVRNSLQAFLSDGLLTLVELERIERRTRRLQRPTQIQRRVWAKGH